MLMRETFSAAKAAGAIAHVSERTRPVNALFIRLSPRAALRCARSCSFHRLKLDRQIFYFWLHDFLVITIAHFDCVHVRASFEHDVVLLGQILVYVGWQAIEIAKRRHRADAAVGEDRLQLLFLVQRDAFADRFLDFLQIDLMVCRQHHHQVLLSRFYHDDLGMMPALHMLGLGESLCSYRLRMMQDFVLHLAVIQTIDQSLWY